MRQCKLILTKKTTRITLANEVHLMRDGTLTVFNYAIQGRPHMPPGNWTHVPQLLSPHASPPELRNTSSYSTEKPARHNQGGSRSVQLEKARTQQPRPSTGRRGRKGMQEVPGGPEVGALCFYCRGHVFDSWSELRFCTPWGEAKNKN